MGVTLDNLPQSWVMGSKQVGIILLKVQQKAIRKLENIFGIAICQ